MHLKKTSLSSFVYNDEPLTRYIFSKEHYSRNGKRVKRQAFMPPSNKKLSVIRSQNCSENSVLKIGKK